ncbi:hypothetical protein CLAIMM_01493 [Cladophialophora immunda]|nr:hypothetical protein CLAIMM_01493 [Cladophialophora immunda]
MAKIIIIGAGISGLSTYLFLRKHLVLSDPSPSPQQFEIKIYEAYDIQQSRFNASLTRPTTSNNLDEGTTARAIPANETDPIFTPQAIGAAIGIARNGLNVLARLDEPQHHRGEARDVRPRSLIEEMAVHGHPIERWELGTARGFTLGEVDLARTRTAAAKPSVKQHEHSKAPSSAGRNPCPYHGIMIARQSCWEILRDRVLRESPDAVIHKKVVDVVIGDEGTRNVIKFEDGTHEEADLVIGADGLRSVLRRAMFRKAEAENESSNATTTSGARTHEELSPDQTRKSASSWLQTVLSYLPIPAFLFGRATGPKVIHMDYISPHYEGLVGVGGFVPSSVLQATGHKPGTMTVVFGPNGFFGYGYLTSSTSSPESPNLSSNDATATGDTGATPSTTAASSIPAPGPLAGWWSTCSSPTPFPYSSSSSDPPSPSSGGVLNTNTSTNTGTSTSKNAVTSDHSASTSRKPTEFNKRLALAALLHRHRKWHNPAIQAILSFVQEDTEQEQQRQRQDQQGQGHHNNDNSNNSLLTGKALDAAYPTWTTPELPYWSLRGRAVLVGDASHALQPSSGQGASQALEDAEALALFLRRSLVVAMPSSSRPEDVCSTKAAAAAAAAAASAGGESPSSISTSTDPAAGSTSTSISTCVPVPLNDPNASFSLPHPLPHACLTTALRAFEMTRMPRVHAIHARSQRMSRMKADMGVLAEWAMYLAIYLGTWFRGANGEGEGGERDERYYDVLVAERGPLDK